MKFLEYTPLARVNTFFNHVKLGDYVFEGTLEAYSCKLAGMDKKLSRSVEQEVVDSLAVSPQDLATSPVGPLSSSSSRRTLIYLILTLNHLYPDYDFSMVRAHDFVKESLSTVKQKIDLYLVELAKVWEEQLGEELSLSEVVWTAIDAVVGLVDCDTYTYKADVDGGPFSEKGGIWAFNYFFYNKKLKRILYFSCRCSRTSADDTSSDDIPSENDPYFANDMDLDEE